MTHVDPSQPIDFNQARVAAEERENTPTASPSREMVIGTRVFPLVRKVSVFDALDFEEARRNVDEDLRGFLKAMSVFVAKDHRAEFLDYVFSDPDSEDDVVGLDDLIDAANKAQEDIAQRPLSK